MKKIIIILFVIILNCEFVSTENSLIYYIESEQETEITVIYKDKDSYISETTATPFYFEQSPEIQDDYFYYYLETSSSNNENLKITIYYSNEIKRQAIYPKINPVKLSGYIGDNLTTVNINY